MKVFQLAFVNGIGLMLIGWVNTCGRCRLTLSNIIPFSDSSPSIAYDVLATLACIGAGILAAIRRRRSDDENG